MTSTHVDSGLYIEVQQLFARQMHCLDGRKLEGYANTFTEDGVLAHTPNEEPARTRAGILRDLYRLDKRFDGDPAQTRHWFNMIDVEPLEDDSIRATYYALVAVTRPGGKPEIAPSCVVHDILVRTEEGLLTKSRWVEHDDLL